METLRSRISTEISRKDVEVSKGVWMSNENDLGDIFDEHSCITTGSLSVTDEARPFQPPRRNQPSLIGALRHPQLNVNTTTLWTLRVYADPI